jgi:hypothetical protein
VATLNRSSLRAAPSYAEDFLAAQPAGKWDEYPQPAGCALRTKYWSGGTSQSSRGCGINAAPGKPLEGESQLYSNYGYKVGSTVFRSPFTQNDDNTFTITASPATPAEAKAAASLGSNGGMRTTPKYLSGLLATDFKGYGLWEVRVRRRLTAKNDFGAIWWQGFPGALRNEIDFEFVGNDGKVYLNKLNGMDRYWSPRKTPSNGPQVPVAHDWSQWSTLQMLRTRELITLARDETILKTYTNDGVEQPMQLVINLAKDGCWIDGLGWIGDGTEVSSMDIDFIKFWEAK